MYNFLLYSSQLPDSLFRSFSLFSTVFFHILLLHEVFLKNQNLTIDTKLR